MTTLDSQKSKVALPSDAATITFTEDYNPNMYVARSFLLYCEAKSLAIPHFVLAARPVCPMWLSHIIRTVGQFATIVSWCCFIQSAYFEKQAFIVSGSGGKATSQGDQRVVDPYFVKLMAQLRKTVHSMSEQSSTLKASLTKDNVTIHFTGEVMQRLLTALMAWLDLAQRRCFKELALKLDEQATACEAASPRWNHIITNDSYKGNLARRQLLSEKTRTALPVAESRLASLLESIKSLPVLWNLGKSAEEVNELSESVTNAQSIAQMSADAMTIVAACNIVEEFGATAQGKAHAQTFLAANKMANFPKSLDARLRQIADK